MDTRTHTHARTYNDYDKYQTNTLRTTVKSQLSVLSLFVNFLAPPSIKPDEFGHPRECRV